jgi:Mn-containing catalase
VISTWALLSPNLDPVVNLLRLAPQDANITVQGVRDVLNSWGPGSQGSKQALQFLMTREITHMRAFTAALDSMENSQFAVGIIQPTPGLVDQFFNGSTGESQYGETDFKGPWNSGNGLDTVQSEIKAGEGLDVTPYDPKPRTEPTSPVDSTPRG